MIFQLPQKIFEMTALRHDLRQGNGADNEIQKAFAKAAKLAYEKNNFVKTEGQESFPLTLILTSHRRDQGHLEWQRWHSRVSSSSQH